MLLDSGRSVVDSADLEAYRTLGRTSRDQRRQNRVFTSNFAQCTW